MKTDLPLEQIPWALAGATVLCQRCKGTGSIWEHHEPPGAEQLDCPDDCKGGLVDVFPASVRLPCPCNRDLPYQGDCKICWQYRTQHESQCENCHGLSLGYVPAKDGWWEAARDAGFDLYVGTSHVNRLQFDAEAGKRFGTSFFVRCDTVEEAVFRALLAAVSAMSNVTLGKP